jgi:hypothetical protein
MECAACESDLRSKLENVELCNDPNICECYITLTPDMVGPMCEDCRRLFKEYIDHRGLADEMILNAISVTKDKKEESDSDIDSDSGTELLSDEVNIADLVDMESGSENLEEEAERRHRGDVVVPRGIREFIDICIEWCDVNPRLLKEMRSVNVSYYVEKGLLDKYDCRYCRRVGKKYNGHPWGQCPNYHRASSRVSYPHPQSSTQDFFQPRTGYPRKF